MKYFPETIQRQRAGATTIEKVLRRTHQDLADTRTRMKDGGEVEEGCRDQGDCDDCGDLIHR